jgi:hypothetical protein
LLETGFEFGAIRRIAKFGPRSRPERARTRAGLPNLHRQRFELIRDSTLLPGIQYAEQASAVKKQAHTCD